MSFFNNLTTEGMEEVQDRIGGYQALESGIYTGTIKALYAGKSKGGAQSLTLIADLGGQEYRETLWITNRNGENFWIQKNSGKKSPLPGFTVADDLCLIATGAPLAEQEVEEKMVNVYDPDLKKEVPTSVPMVINAIGKEVSLGIIKQLVNKREKVGEKYVEVADSREENLIDKVFHPELRVTVPEARRGEKEPQFWDTWLKANKDKTRDRRKHKDGQGPAADAGGPPQANQVANTAPRKSLFT